MKIETPFGAMEIYFHTNNHCTLFSNKENGIFVDGVKLCISQSVAFIDGRWQTAMENHDGNFHITTYLNLYHWDYNRNDSPSESVRITFSNWIQNVLLPNFNLGIYDAECLAAERDPLKKQIQRLREKIIETEKKLEVYRLEIFKNTVALNDALTGFPNSIYELSDNNA